MLILLTTCRRKTEILALSQKYMYYYPQRIVFILTKLPKTFSRTRAHDHSRWFTVKQFPTNRKLCPVRALATYILRTEHIRSTDMLFVTTPPYGAIRPMTLNRWILQSMQQAGVSTQEYSPYTTRHASSSGALNQGMALDDVLALGGWSKPSTFIKHYNLPIIKGALPAQAAGEDLYDVTKGRRYIPPLRSQKFIKMARAKQASLHAKACIEKSNKILAKHRKQQCTNKPTDTQTIQTETMQNETQENPDTPSPDSEHVTPNLDTTPNEADLIQSSQEAVVDEVTAPTIINKEPEIDVETCSMKMEI